MAIATLKLDEKGSREFAAALHFMRGRVENPQPILTEMARYMVNAVRDRIRTGHKSPEGVPWEPLTWQTVLTNAYAGDSDPSRPLYRSATHTLWSEINARVKRDGFEVTANATNIYGRKYASYQNSGTRGSGRGRKTVVPARPFMGFSSRNKKILADMLRNYIFASDHHES